MKNRLQNLNMKNQLRAILLGVTFSLASAGVSHAMSELVSMSKEPVWPTSPTPDGNLVYNITTVGRAGAGLLEVTLTAADMPPGITVTFSPSVLRFTGNQVSSQTATMTVSCTGLIPIDCFPFSITGTSQREVITVTNQVFYSAEFLATRPATLTIDQMTNDSLRIRGAGATGKTYQIEAASSLNPSQSQTTANLINPVWIPLGTATADANGRFTFFTTQTAGSPVRFFRAFTSAGPVQ
jgi:hypothetical protein